MEQNRIIWHLTAEPRLWRRGLGVTIEIITFYKAFHDCSGTKWYSPTPTPHLLRLVSAFLPLFSPAPQWWNSPKLCPRSLASFQSILSAPRALAITSPLCLPNLDLQPNFCSHFKAPPLILDSHICWHPSWPSQTSLEPNLFIPAPHFMPNRMAAPPAWTQWHHSLPQQFIPFSSTCKIPVNTPILTLSILV